MKQHRYLIRREAPEVQAHNAAIQLRRNGETAYIDTDNSGRTVLVTSASVLGVALACGSAARLIELPSPYTI